MEFRVSPDAELVNPKGVSHEKNKFQLLIEFTIAYRRSVSVYKQQMKIFVIPRNAWPTTSYLGLALSHEECSTLCWFSASRWWGKFSSRMSVSKMTLHTFRVAPKRIILNNCFKDSRCLERTSVEMLRNLDKIRSDVEHAERMLPCFATISAHNLQAKLPTL